MYMRLVLCLCAVLWLVDAAVADVPQLINYQGRLTSGGTVITDPVDVVFAIWNAATDGDSLWSEQRIVTPDENGAFIMLLGSESPIPDSAFAGDAFLSIQVESDPEMSPRAQIVSVGYAYRVGSLEGATGGGITGGIIIDDPAGDTVSIGPDKIVIRGAGGDEDEVNCSSNGITVTDQNGDVRINISIDEDGPGITLFESAAGLYKENLAAGGRKVEFREGGVLLYGTSDADTVCHLFPSGNIFGKGQLAMGDNHTASGDWSNVLGYNNEASGDSAVVSGGYNNAASGHAATVSGGLYNTAGSQATAGEGIAATVGGGQDNHADTSFATVSGGRNNDATGWGSTIAGGGFNNASGGKSTVGGGYFNDATDLFSTVAGGTGNVASGDGATVAGGVANHATGDRSTIPGGAENAALGRHAVALGGNAKANHAGSIVIATLSASSLGDSVQSGGTEQIVLRADGGLYLTNTAELAPYDNTNIITTRGGAYLSGNGTNWTNASDRNQKENFTELDRSELLEKIAALDITRWNYKGESESVTHVGPMAQDFHALFNVGTDDKSISTIDPAGIALAAIQGLYQQNLDLKQHNTELTERLAKLESLVQHLLESK